LLLTAVACWAASDDAAGWSAKSAASYLDQRAEWWAGWQRSARDHGTFCVSCHTALPYALARPALRGALGESGPSAPERKLLENIATRVRQWSEVKPFYSDPTGAKQVESRTTEAVLNALILSSYDPRTADARAALQNMWELQVKTGEQQGSFTWLNFHNAPWEYEESPYWGATLAALAASSQPAESRPSGQVKLLAEYLRRDVHSTTLLNRVFLLYAASRLPGLIDRQTSGSIVAEIRGLQREDGGWNLASLTGGWKRKDETALETASDGYATGLIALALERSGVPRKDPALARGLAWLAGHQNRSEGFWPSWSLNKKRDPESDVGRFMPDAATAYAVLALTSH